MSIFRWNRAKGWLRTNLAPALVVLFVAGFIGADLVTASGWNWQGWLRSLRGRPPQAPDLSEIRDYVEFVTVPHNALDIVTGIRFASTFDRRITHQWCYAEPTKRAPGDISYRVDLAVWEKPGPPERYTYTHERLRPFGLTPADAQSLLDNHCRFRDN